MKTQHVVTRAQQRGIKESDLDLVCAYGTQINGGYVIRRRDIRAAEQKLKDTLRRLEKLDRVYVAFKEGDLITTFRMSKEQLRRSA